MIHCITLAVSVKGQSKVQGRVRCSQADTVDHINQRSVLDLFHPRICYNAIVNDIF